jgi:hypothetical protein
MNGITHLVTGYFIARIVRRSPGEPRHAHDEFATVFTAIASMVPDIDLAIGIPHATITHTLVMACLLAIGYATLVFAIGFKFFRKAHISLVQLIALALLAVLGHLGLDIFTYLGKDCATTQAHLYFWPAWNQSFHLDCLIAPVSWVYLMRVLVEWAFYSPFLLVLLVYRGIKYKENPFAMFFPDSWLKRANMESFYDQSRIMKGVLVILDAIFMAIIVVELLGAVIVFGD